jgi:Zn-finger nucleic acid-binding protein
MKCPICNVELKIAERSGVEIDFCPQCRGVWLDRGELDKIIERAGMMATDPARVRAGYEVEPRQPQYEVPRRKPDYDYDDDDDDYRRRGSYPRKKKKSWLDEIFDF